VDEPASARVAGVISRTDADKGFWWSPSNKLISGISGTARPMPFELGDTVSETNVLNENKIATIICEDGYRLWGNRTTSSDARWSFLSTRRIADMINESIQQAHLWAVDRPVGKTYFEAVQESVNQFLRTMQQKGAILGGKCWVDTEINSASEIEQGHTYFDFDFTPAYTAERVTFRSRMTNGYVEEVFK
jgi:phage tail sheath protein FI